MNMCTEEDLDCVILMSLPAPETYDFYYVMGFIISENALRHIDAGEAVGVRDNHTLEMALGIAGKGRTESEWEHFVATYVDGQILRVQTGCVLPHGKAGAACVERLIEKTQRLGREVPMAMLDCFREASGGWMHHTDTRRWRMSTGALFHMEREINELKERISQCSLRNFEVQFIRKIGIYGSCILIFFYFAQITFGIRDLCITLEASRRIVDDYEKENTANLISTQTYKDHAALLEQTEIELNDLEAQQMDTLIENDALHVALERLLKVLRFQRALLLTQPSVAQKRKQPADAPPERVHRTRRVPTGV